PPTAVLHERRLARARGRRLVRGTGRRPGAAPAGARDGAAGGQDRGALAGLAERRDGGGRPRAGPRRVGRAALVPGLPARALALLDLNRSPRILSPPCRPASR